MYGSDIFVCKHHEDQEFLLLENPLKDENIDEDEIVEHALGGSVTSVIPTHVEGNISKLVVGPLFIRGEFEELSLLEDFMVELTFSGPAYEVVYMDEGIGDSPWFKHEDILGEAIDTSTS
ncbi:hypothetical protein SUGI_0672680 [Cryptomeria japonica]|nr:hypothetical protein SUGI_0672680 [Cryptomeria japonica]